MGGAVHYDRLAGRDKGKGIYDVWFAYGRTQALNDNGYKLLFPYMAKNPHFVLTLEKNLMIYCGYAIFSNDVNKLKILKKILESDVFWYYIKHTSKPYSGGYFSLAKNYVKHFSICKMSGEEESFLLKQKMKMKLIDSFQKNIKLIFQIFYHNFIILHIQPTP